MKSSGKVKVDGVEMSLPSRERGLKFSGNRYEAMKDKSLPSRERGLKSIGYFGCGVDFGRSLHGSVD